MKKILFLIALVAALALPLQAQYFSTKTVNVEYIILDNGDVVPSKSKITISNNKITVLRNGETKNWDVEYQGISNITDSGIGFKNNSNNNKGVPFKHHVFYLTRHKVYFMISEDKMVKHGDRFYYRIVLDGQTQLAY